MAKSNPSGNILDTQCELEVAGKAKSAAATLNASRGKGPEVVASPFNTVITCLKPTAA